MATALPDPKAPQPRWLDDEQRDAWMHFVGVLIQLPAELDAQMQRQADVTQFEYTVMAALSEAPERTLRISTLAQLARGSLSRLSHLIKRLEQRGWVRRETCAADGRYTNAILTDAGYAKVALTAPGHVETVRDLVVDALTATQLRQLREISARILHRIDTDGGCHR
jgi:DNA-binding MarR family transcriptional regulator